MASPIETVARAMCVYMELGEEWWTDCIHEATAIVKALEVAGYLEKQDQK